MALISCPECQQQISDKAAACPHCGSPQSAGIPKASETHVVTTQATAKKFKRAQMGGALLLCLGVVSCAIATQPPTSGNGLMASVFLQFGGLALYFGARIAAWWNHG